MDKNKETHAKDSFEEAYERKLKKYENIMNGDEPLEQGFTENSEDVFADEYTEYGQSRQSTSRGSASQRSGVSSGASRQSSGKSGKPGGSGNVKSSSGKQSSSKSASKKKKKKSSGKHSSSQQHISHDEPLKFGSKKNKNSRNGKYMEEKKKSPVKTFFKAIFIIILVLFILLQLLIFRYLGMVNYADKGDRLYTSGSIDSSNVTNILLIGSDSRDEDSNGRTDTMILLSINKSTKEITMTSFMRDMYVEIPNNGWAKLNAAYAYGGAELLMDTLEYNFDVSIDDYVFVDFYGFIDIVDAVGGIELDVTDAEAEAMTDPMNEQNMYLGKDYGTDNLSSGGENLTLNGNQALAYARVRYAGNADFERTERQRRVITKILEKAKTLSPTQLDSFIRVCLSNLTTNMDKTGLYLLTYRVPFVLGYDIKELRIPQEGDYTYGTHNGQSTLDVDFDKCKQLIRDEIYS